MSKRYPVRSAILAVSIVLGAAILSAQPVSDAKIEFSLSQPQMRKTAHFEGKCPYTFSFHSDFNIQNPKSATFYYAHSDGTVSRTETFATFRSPLINSNHNTTKWSIGKSGSYWIQLHAKVESTEITSEKLGFTVVCK